MCDRAVAPAMFFLCGSRSACLHCGCLAWRYACGSVLHVGRALTQTQLRVERQAVRASPALRQSRAIRCRSFALSAGCIDLIHTHRHTRAFPYRWRSGSWSSVNHRRVSAPLNRLSCTLAALSGDTSAADEPFVLLFFFQVSISTSLVFMPNSRGATSHHSVFNSSF